MSTGGPAKAQASAAEVIFLGAGDERIERSCRVVSGPDVRRDPEADGVLAIVGDGITVEFTGELRGAGRDEAADTFSGVGIRVTGKHVTLRGARVAGYKVGIHAVGADGLVLEDCDVSGNYRQHLKSNKEKESDDDWLDPHHDDAHEWFTNYGAGIFVERTSAVTVRRCRARAGQNGLVLERVEQAQVYDNDFSFLSGWGIALWRSCDDVLARNACDFCIRGYSHGVYNRGEDSAGILLFEQCSRNVIAQNSATHCGDGFFCFAGQEALGGVAPPSPDFDYTGKGCNKNLIWGNDFSYAAAHGLELTFSFDNWIHSNRFVGNSICGIWGGYSRRTWIANNDFEDNGAAGYGLERGGIDIEHGLDNAIHENRFRGNVCGVHLWLDEDANLATLPWVRANGDGSFASLVRNSFVGDILALQLRGRTRVQMMGNLFEHVGTQLEATADAVTPDHDDLLPAIGVLPSRPLPGTLHPVDARQALAGREKIVIDDWGPVEPSPR